MQKDFNSMIAAVRETISLGVEKATPYVNKAANYVAQQTSQTTSQQSHKEQYMSNNALNLVKGGTLNLTKATGGLTKFKLNLSWDKGTDLDVSAILLNDLGKRVGILYYNNMTAPGLTHSGDLRDGGEEEITIDTTLLSANRIIAAVTSHSQGADNQRAAPALFGAAAKPVARLINPATNEVLVECNLAEDGALSTAIEFVEIFKRPEDGQWIFKNLSNPLGRDAFGLQEFASKYPE